MEHLTIAQLESIYCTHFKVANTLLDYMYKVVHSLPETEWLDSIEMVEDAKLRLFEIELEITRRSKLN